MKLWKKNFNETSPYPEEFILGEVSPGGDYTDITTIDNLGRLGFLVKNKDYKCVRKLIKDEVAAKTFASCTTSEKQIAAQWFVVERSDRDTIYTTAEQEAYGVQFHLNSIAAREKRFNLVSIIIRNRLVIEDSFEALADFSVFFHAYVMEGIEGTDQGDQEGVTDWLQAKVGTTHENTGLTSRGYTPIGSTLAALGTRVVGIITDGE